MNNELYHYGVKGMRWGVRKKRESSSARNARIDKELSSMTDEELRIRNNRLNMERQYKMYNTPDQSKAQKLVKEVIGNPAKQVAAVLVAMYMKQGVNYVLKKAGQSITMK